MVNDRPGSLIAAAFVLVMVAIAGCGNKRARVAKLIDEADAQLQQHASIESAVLYGQALKLDPQNGHAYLGLARAEMQNRNFGKAEWALLRAMDAVHEERDRLATYVMLSDIYLAQHPREPAYLEGVGRMASEVLKADSGSVDGHRLWAAVAQNQAAISASENRADAATWREKALVEFERSDSIRPNNPGILRGWAETLAASHRNNEAEAMYRRLSVLVPEDTGVHLTIANLTAGRGDSASAAAAVQAALASKTPNASALTDFAKENVSLGNCDQASRVLDYLSQHAAGAVFISDLYLGCGERGRALAFLQSAAAQTDRNDRPAAYARLGQMLEENQAHDQAVRTAEDCLKAYPKSAACKAIKLYETGRSKIGNEEVMALERLAAQNVGDPLPLLYLGRLYQDKGRLVEARIQFDLGVRAFPADSALRLARSRLEMTLNEPFPARADALSVLKEYPKRQEALAVLERVGR